MQALKLDDDLPVLLVVGGSKGARSINQALVPQLPTLLDMAQIVHVTGQLDWETVETATASLTPTQKKRYHAYPYLHEQMGAALACRGSGRGASGCICTWESSHSLVCLPFLFHIHTPGVIKK